LKPWAILVDGITGGRQIAENTKTLEILRGLHGFSTGRLSV
jgi:hypothetical protein